MRIFRPAGVSAALGLALLGGMLWAPLAAPAAQAGTAGHCLIINKATDTSYINLQAAQDAATAGATLWVRGTCTGTTEISKNLTITGQHPKGFTAPTLSGGGQGSVLTIDSAATVTINTLTITGGKAQPVGFLSSGGGIDNNGTLTLNDTTVTGNTADTGGGIVNFGTVTLNDTTISGNTAGDVGGGITNGGGTVTMNDSATISGNTASLDGGGIWSEGGTVTMTGSAIITGNTAGDLGGGIFTNGTVTMNDSATITGNTAQEGGGIWSQGGTVTMTGSAIITGNTADVTGGGILNHCGTLNGAVAGAGGNVFGNKPDDIVSVC